MKITQILIAHKIEPGQTIAIEGDEFHYLSRVRRERTGSSIVILAQNGTRFSGTVTRLGEQRAEASVEKELEPAAAPWPVHLLVAVPKHQLMDELIRRVSEIGIESLTPVATTRGVQKAGSTRLSRWHKIAAQSMRQCSRAIPLRLNPICDFSHALERRNRDGTGYLFHPAGPGILASGVDPQASSRIGSPITLAVGPEGGFSKSEVELASSHGFEVVGLGPTILRIETAAVAASVLAVAMLGGYSLPLGE